MKKNIIFGFIVLALGILFLWNDVNFRKDSVPVTGTVTRVQNAGVGTKMKHYVYVTFQYKDKMYENWSFTTKKILAPSKGDKIEVYFNEELEKIDNSNEDIVISSIFVLAGLAFIFEDFITRFIVKLWRLELWNVKGENNDD